MMFNNLSFKGRLRPYALLPLMLAAFTLSACAPKANPNAPEQGVTQGKSGAEANRPAVFDITVLPATFRGSLPCSECEKISVQLNMRPDRTFVIKRIYQKAGKETNPVIDQGTWTLSPDGTDIALSLNQRLLENFKMIASKCMETGHGGKLCMTESFKPIEASTEMRGLYSYMADLGMFRDCITSERYPVAMGKDNGALERAYLKSEHGIAEPLVARFMGHVTTRPAMEGSRMDKVVVVDKFIELTDEHSCTSKASSAAAQAAGSTSTAGADMNIENRKWELIEIAGMPVSMPPGVPAPGFRLNPEGKNLRGFGGCNRMMGSYILDGNKLMFSGIATTRKFCVETEGLETRFVQALGQVRRFTIEGNELTLYGDYGELARLRAAN